MRYYSVMGGVLFKKHWNEVIITTIDLDGSLGKKPKFSYKLQRNFVSLKYFFNQSA